MRSEYAEKIQINIIFSIMKDTVNHLYTFSDPSITKMSLKFWHDQIDTHWGDKS